LHSNNLRHLQHFDTNCRMFLGRNEL
jgi:hypothetical protein